MVNVETIINWLQTQIESKLSVSPHVWLDAASKLNVLLGGEHDKFFELSQQVANLKKLRIEDGDSVAKAKIYVEATNDYKEMCKQKAKIDRVVETIRLAKQMSRMAVDEARGNI